MTDAKTGVISLATIGALATAIYFIEERYAHATDMRGLGDSIAKQMTVNQLATEVAVLELRRNSVIDKVSEGVARDSKRPGDRAIAERYSIELKDTDAQLRDKRRQIDQLRTK